MPIERDFLRDIATLSERQLDPIRASHLFRFVLLGASSGCGKTRVLVAWCAYRNMLAHKMGVPPTKVNSALMSRDAGLVVSRFEKEIRELLIDTGLGEVKGATKLSPHAFHFYDKRFGKIVFWSLYDIQDLRGQEFIHAAIDELTEVPEDVFHEVNWRVRYFGKGNYKPTILSATNPDGIYADWVKEYFVTKTFRTPLGSNIKSTYADEFHYVPMSLDDNPNEQARSTYLRVLLSLPDHLRRARLYGDWDVSVGARFPYPVSFVNEVPEEVSSARGIDWGFAKEKFACVWVSKDREGNYYVTKVLKSGGMTLTESARKVKELSSKKAPTFADPTMFSQREPHSLYTLSYYFLKEGIPLIPSTNNHAITNSLIEHLLEGKKLFFLRSGEGVHLLIRDIHALRFSSGKNPENLIPHENTDTVYALGYALYGLSPIHVRKETPCLAFSSDEIRKLIYEEISKKIRAERDSITRPI